MRVLPRTAFGRTALIIAGVLLLSQIPLVMMLRHFFVGPAARQMAHQLVDQVVMLETLVQSTGPADRPALLQRLAERQDLYLLTGGKQPSGGGPLVYYQERIVDVLRERLGAQAQLRVQIQGERVLWVRTRADAGYWLGMSARRLESGVAGAFLAWVLALSGSSVIIAFLLARHLTRRLRGLARLAGRVGQGELPESFDQDGPEEIRALASAMERMARDLRQGQADRALLLAGISHDLRTPLARIRLAAEMLPASESDTRDGMVEDIEEMDAIVGQFIASVRDGNDETPTRVSLNELVAPVCERFRRMGGQLTVDLQPSPPLELRPLAITRMLSNLLENARRHGAGADQVRGRRDGDRYLLSVLDRGPGMTAEALGRVFRPFSHGGKGSGLGLVVARRIARLHGGELSLHPRPGGGLEARVELPV